jgi:hypothetical protein
MVSWPFMRFVTSARKAVYSASAALITRFLLGSDAIGPPWRVTGCSGTLKRSRRRVALRHARRILGTIVRLIGPPLPDRTQALMDLRTAGQARSSKTARSFALAGRFALFVPSRGRLAGLRGFDCMSVLGITCWPVQPAGAAVAAAGQNVGACPVG